MGQDVVSRLTVAPSAPAAGFGTIYPLGASDAALEWYFKRPNGDVLTLLHREEAQTLSGALTLTSASPQLTLGVLNTTSGGIKFFGSTSGNVTLAPNVAAGASVTVTLPATSVTLNAAGDLTGTTLAAGVVASSLTSVGTLTSLGVGAITGTGNVTITKSLPVLTLQSVGDTDARIVLNGNTGNGYGAYIQQTTLSSGAVSQAWGIGPGQSGGTNAWELRNITAGTSPIKVSIADAVTILSLAGTGTRTVVVDANGVLSAP